MKKLMFSIILSIGVFMSVNAGDHYHTMHGSDWLALGLSISGNIAASAAYKPVVVVTSPAPITLVAGTNPVITTTNTYTTVTPIYTTPVVVVPNTYYIKPTYIVVPPRQVYYYPRYNYYYHRPHYYHHHYYYHHHHR